MDTLPIFELFSKLAQFERHIWKPIRGRRGPPPRLSLAHLATVCIARAWFQVPCWKAFFCNPIIQHGWKTLGGFELGSYSRFMLNLRTVSPFLEQWCQHHHVPWSGLGAIDSTLLPLGKPWNRYNTFCYKHLRKESASPGHGSTGPCFGMKLHLAVTREGKVHQHAFSSAKTHDLTMVKRGLLSQALGIVLGDSGYVGKTVQKALAEKSVALWAKPARHHEEQFSPIQAKLYRYREVAESVFAKLKGRFQLIPLWPPRTMATALAHFLGSLAAYLLCPNKPTMNWSLKDFRA